jgi:hypothetical protein
VFPNETKQQQNLIVNPADGSTGVQLSIPVILTFAKPVIKGIVEENFHLISAKDMADSMSHSHPIMNHSNMMMAMADSAIMQHLDRYHSTHGIITWNSDSTLCTFMPDSMLTRQTEYMIHLGDEMVKMMKQRMGNMGLMSDDIILHFNTID